MRPIVCGHGSVGQSSSGSIAIHYVMYSSFLDDVMFDIISQTKKCDTNRMSSPSESPSSECELFLGDIRSKNLDSHA